MVLILTATIHAVVSFAGEMRNGEKSDAFAEIGKVCTYGSIVGGLLRARVGPPPCTTPVRSVVTDMMQPVSISRTVRRTVRVVDATLGYD